ncbi:MAG: SPFH domain-containing protein, partial [Candidatus Jordarchaeaceae archaeon]
KHDDIIWLRIVNEGKYLKSVKRISVKPNLWVLIYDGTSSGYTKLVEAKVYEVSKNVTKKAASEIIFCRRDVLTVNIGISWFRSRIYTKDGLTPGINATMKFIIADPLAFKEFIVGDCKVFTIGSFATTALPAITSTFADIFREYEARSVINKLEREEIFTKVLSKLSNDLMLWGVELISLDLNSEPTFPPDQLPIIEKIKKTELEKLLDERDRLGRELQEWREKLEKLEREYFDGKIDGEVYNKRLEFAKLKIKEIEEQQKKINSLLT